MAYIQLSISSSSGMIKALCKNLIILLITIQMTRSELQSSNGKVTIGRYQLLDLVLKYTNFHGLL